VAQKIKEKGRDDPTITVRGLERIKSEQVVGSATRGTAIRSNFGIKSFYPKIGGMC
jgi:hypothetical protein